MRTHADGHAATVSGRPKSSPLPVPQPFLGVLNFPHTLACPQNSPSDRPCSPPEVPVLSPPATAAMTARSALIVLLVALVVVGAHGRALRQASREGYAAGDSGKPAGCL